MTFDGCLDQEEAADTPSTTAAWLSSLRATPLPGSWRGAIARAQHIPEARALATVREAQQRRRALASGSRRGPGFAIPYRATSPAACARWRPDVYVLKAITATARRAVRMSSTCHPCYLWIEGEDHDWDEVRKRVLDPNSASGCRTAISGVASHGGRTGCLDDSHSCKEKAGIHSSETGFPRPC